MTKIIIYGLKIFLQFKDNEILKQVQNDNPISDRLLQILKTVKKINPKFLDKNHGYEINTQLEFPKNWGLGTSSTLIQ